MDRALALALDLGSTRVKAGRLTAGGTLVPAGAAGAPHLTGQGTVREGDAAAYLEVAGAVLAQAVAADPGLPVGIACQRSSFVLWEAASGRPVTPLVSWQDRRADRWCAAHRAREAELTARTGLPLSPHYAGPKLAVLLAADPGLGEGLATGRLRFGTLETYLLWHLSGAQVHHTDLSMAARTLMVDLGRRHWSDPLLATFGVPRAGLPAIGASAGLDLEMDGGTRVAATLADQGAAALAALGEAPGTALVNLGTGGFVLRRVAGPGHGPEGYLLGPLCRAAGGTAWAAEGTINGIGPLVAGLKGGPTSLAEDDPAPDAFCLPDAAGVGAPHWRAGLGPVFSPAAESLGPAGRRRAALEGIVFRVREIVDDLARDAPVTRLLVAGGLAAGPDTGHFLTAGLAACTGREVARLEEPEATLLGAARLAAGVPQAAPGARAVAAAGGYLGPKYARWRAWLEGVLA
jgi:glycerol kinase